MPAAFRESSGWSRARIAALPAIAAISILAGLPEPAPAAEQDQLSVEALSSRPDMVSDDDRWSRWMCRRARDPGGLSGHRERSRPELGIRGRRGRRSRACAHSISGLSPGPNTCAGDASRTAGSDPLPGRPPPPGTDLLRAAADPVCLHHRRRRPRLRRPIAPAAPRPPRSPTTTWVTDGGFKPARRPEAAARRPRPDDDPRRPDRRLRRPGRVRGDQPLDLPLGGAGARWGHRRGLEPAADLQLRRRLLRRLPAGHSGIGTVLDDRSSPAGYSVVASSLNVLNTACNDVLSAETVSMIKEHVIESLGRGPASGRSARAARAARSRRR